MTTQIEKSQIKIREDMHGLRFSNMAHKIIAYLWRALDNRGYRLLYIILESIRKLSRATVSSGG